MLRFEQTAVRNLVHQRLEELKLSPRTVIERLGYRNINRGLCRLEALCSHAHATAEFIERLATALALPLGALQRACAETRQALRDEREQAARERFRPFLSVETAGPRTMGLVIAALAWSTIKQIQLPKDIPSWKLDDQLQHIRQLIATHHQREEGMVRGFGSITGYVYHQTFDHRIAFSVRGDVMDPFAPPPFGPPEVTLNGRPASVSFLRGDGHG